MNFYKKEILRIKVDYYSNQWQIDTVIGLKNYMNKNFKEKLNLESLFSYPICFKISPVKTV